MDIRPMICQSKSWKALVVMSHAAHPELALYGVCAMALTLLLSSPFDLKAQTAPASKKPRSALARSKSIRSQSQKPQLLFDYYPEVLGQAVKESEYVFVAIANDGSTQVVRYGQYNPAIIGVYKGRLPKADVARLVKEAESIIPKASEINKPYAHSCDSDHFQLSLRRQNGSATQVAMPEPACLLMMPEEISRLVEEIRTMVEAMQ